MRKSSLNRISATRPWHSMRPKAEMAMMAMSMVSDYIANNNKLYNAALGGFLAGVYQSKDIGFAPGISFTDIVNQATLFAQAVDQLIPSGGPSQGQQGLLRGIVQSTMADKYSIDLPATAFTDEAEAVVNLYNAAASSFLPESNTNAPFIPLIFRAGATPSDDVYVTAAAVAAAIDSVNGAAIVYVDSSIEPCIIPSGVTWNMQLVGSVIGISDESGSLTIEDGGQIRNPFIIDGCNITVIPKTLPSFDFDADNWAKGPTFTVTTFGAIVQDTTATIAWLKVPTSTSLFGFFFQLLLGGQLLNNGATSVAGIELESGGGGPGSGGSVEFVINFLTNLVSNTTILGDTTTSLQWNADASGYPVPTWTQFTGTFENFPVDTAPGIAYTPAVSGNWVGPAPTTVQEALDRIAANTGNAHPIP